MTFSDTERLKSTFKHRLLVSTITKPLLRYPVFSGEVPEDVVPGLVLIAPRTPHSSEGGLPDDGTGSCPDPRKLREGVLSHDLVGLGPGGLSGRRSLDTPEENVSLAKGLLEYPFSDDVKGSLSYFLVDLVNGNLTEVGRSVGVSPLESRL